MIKFLPEDTEWIPVKIEEERKRIPIIMLKITRGQRRNRKYFSRKRYTEDKKEVDNKLKDMISKFRTSLSFDETEHHRYYWKLTSKGPKAYGGPSRSQFGWNIISPELLQEWGLYGPLSNSEKEKRDWNQLSKDLYG